MGMIQNTSRISLAIATLLIAVPVFAQVALTEDDKVEIGKIFTVISESIRDGDADSALRSDYLSPNADDSLESDIFIESPVADSENSLTFSKVEEASVSINANGNLEATYTATMDYYDGFFEEHYISPNITFTFEKVDGYWYLLASDYYNNFKSTGVSTSSTTNVSPALGWGLLALFGVLILIALALFVFWVWMLIEAIKRKGYPGKPFWIIGLILFSTLAAIVYYFAEHRPYKKSLMQPVQVPPVSPTPPQGV